ncbi:alpha/beta hydrolase fold domain-containing protein [Mycolicibacterium hippocampi]|uniref:alpha/beta hydrolase n=1 Tax=Mycolicibacterium hippocampi TaxID=659824 RepID=UPI00351500B9
MRGGPSVGKFGEVVGEVAVLVGVGAAVFTGWGCAVASADDDAAPSSESSERSDPGPKRDDAPARADAAADTADAPDDDADADDAPDDDDETDEGETEVEVTDGDIETGDDTGETDEAPTPPVEVVTPTATTRTETLEEPAVAPAEESAPDLPEDLPPPAAAPQLWSMLGAARRDAETADITTPVEPHQTAEVQTTSQTLEATNTVTYTPESSFFDQLVVFSLRIVRGISSFIGIDLYGLIGKVLESDRPPWWVKSGLDVRRTEYQVSDEDVWDVWEFRPPNPTGKTVIAVHGGGFIVEPLLTHWVDYSNMARDTGATVLVPMYPLATTDAGTAVKLVPAMAQYISDRIAADGAENVSIYADSAGPQLALGAVRELILAGAPIPASMVLLSFAPDASLSNPDIYEVDDPIIDVRNLDFYTDVNYYGDGLDPKDPMVSALFMEDEVLAAMPATTIYVGELEWVLPDTLLLQEKWSAAGGVVSTVVGLGQYHDWALGFYVNSQSSRVRPDIYRQLGLNGVAAGPRTVVTGPPSFGDQLVVGTLRFLRSFSEATGIKLFSGVVGTVTTVDPPPSTTTGLNVTERSYNGWKVWELASPQPSGEYVVALHGGGFESEANIIHWSDYAEMARDTGATVLVPIYPLAPPKGTGTASTLVPPMADYLSMLIDEHGVDNVSLYGDSSGGSYAMLAVQEMLRRCRSDVQCVVSESQPSRMVLVSPALHLTLSGPEVDAIDDPILPSRPAGEGPQFNGELDMDDPRVNPISSADLTGLPPTAVYIGTLEKLYPGALAFRDKLLAQDPDADFTVVIGDGQLHGWALGGLYINSQAPVWRSTVYRQLGLLPQANSARYVTVQVA